MQDDEIKLAAPVEECPVPQKEVSVKRRDQSKFREPSFFSRLFHALCVIVKLICGLLLFVIVVAILHSGVYCVWTRIAQPEHAAKLEGYAKEMVDENRERPRKEICRDAGEEILNTLDAILDDARLQQVGKKLKRRNNW